MGVIKNRIGETNYNNQGLLMEIIEYNKAIDMTVRFVDSGYICKCRYGNFQRGEVYDKFTKCICGVGYIGNTSSSLNNKPKKSYKKWLNMVHRCYDNSFKAYEDKYVCNEWLCFENFEKWFDENYYEIENEVMCLDKDILVKGNKVYSPNTCIFVPNSINILFTNLKNENRDSLIGTHYSKEKDSYIAYCNINGETTYIGIFKTEIDAFNAYKEAKEKHIKEVADKYKDKIPKKLYDAMYNWKVETTD